MKRGRVYFGLLAILMIAAFAVGLSSYVREVSVLSPPSSLQKLDAIVVLTGGSNRLDTGFDLFERGLGGKLFISGVAHGLDVRQLLKRWKSEPQSHLDCCVVLGFEADNTVGNAVETLAFLRHEGFHSFYLVTANYHMKRALLEFNRLAPDLRITPFPVVPDKMDMKSWWADPTTRNLLLREYMKYIAASLRSYL